jgi:hypothetical protein
MKGSREFLNGSNLKWIAMITMLIDHMGYLLLGYGVLWVLPESAIQYVKWYRIYWMMRCVGRVAFPVYAFLLTEGIAHTRDWKRYAWRLGIFAFLSEIPFDFMCFQKPFSMAGQNVFFTLLIGLLTVKAAEHASGRISGEKRMTVWIVITGLGCVTAVLLRTDYDYTGVILIVLLHLLRGTRIRQCVGGFFWLAISLKSWQYLGGLAFAFLLIGIYNGERGSGRGKYAFYAFYPLHMLALYLLYQWMMPNIGSIFGFTNLALTGIQ